MSLAIFGCGGGALSVQDYVNTYCVPGAQKLGTWVPIGKIASFLMKFIVTTIMWFFGVSALHLATHNHMHLGVECLQNTVFYWCSGLVMNMKKKLNDTRLGKKKNFG